jgi:hypothetical protein
MNKEQQELLDEAYRKYADSHWTPPSNPKGKLLSDQLFSLVPMEHSKESFINKCKTNNEFSEKWGLKIEERELSLEERCSLANFAPFDDRFPDGDDFKWDEHTINIAEDWLKQHHPNLPTKLITITYNNKTIENYE